MHIQAQASRQVEEGQQRHTRSGLGGEDLDAFREQHSKAWYDGHRWLTDQLV